MTRTARLVAAAAFCFLLFSGVINWAANSIANSRPSAVLLGLVLLAPVAVVVVLLIRSRLARIVLAHIARSRSHLVVAALALIGFVLTLVPWKSVDQWMVIYLALASTTFALVLFAADPSIGRLHALLRPAVRWLLYRLGATAFLLLMTGLVFIVTNLISWLVFQHFPHVVDSIAQVFQGRIFASGQIAIPARFDNYFFSLSYVINDGTKIYAEYPFGHSLLLALGSLVRAEWLVNPLLGSAEIAVLYCLGKEAYDEKTGRVAALLGAFSPFLLLMSSEYMNHASALLFLSLFLLFFLRTIRPMRLSEPSFLPGPSSRLHLPGVADPLLSGLSLAMALNIRPLSALAVSIPSACYGLYLALKSRGRLVPSLLLLLVPVLLGLGAFGLYNYLTTGDALLPGYKVFTMLEYGHSRWGLGFGTQGYAGRPPHTPLRGLIQTGDNLNFLNLSLFEGPFPGLLVVLLLLLTFTRNTADWLLLATFAALPAAYFFYWFQEFAFGPRLLYEGMAPLLLLTARGMSEFPRFVGRTVGVDAETRTRDLVAGGTALSLAVTALFGLPKAAAQYAHRCYGVDNQAHARVTERGISNAIVFLGPTRTFYFGAGLLNNGLVFDGPVVYARDRGTENYVLMQQFPGRDCYYADPWVLTQITNLDSFRNDPLIRDLEQTGQFVRQRSTGDYRYVLLPYLEAGAFIDTGSTRTLTFREVSYDLLRHRSRLDSFLPALAVFLPGDPRNYSPRFTPMRERVSYSNEGCRFSLLFAADSGKAVVYDIRPISDGSDDAAR